MKLVRALYLAVGVIAIFSSQAIAASSSSAVLRPALTTSRGCRETGNSATFAVGDDIIIFLRVGSSTLAQASAALASFKPNGVVTIVSLGSIPTNATFGFVSRVGAPVGLHRLTLKASGGGVISRTSCTINVVDERTPVTPPPTRTPTMTRTPSMTPTPTTTRTINLTPSATPGAALRPHVSTNRGCEETGQQPVFHVGERVSISLGTTSTRWSYASMSLLDTVPDGRTNVFSFGTLTTNQTYTFNATAAPPTGHETLRLRAQAFGSVATSNPCTFTVAP